jgi:CDC-like kinase
MYELYSGNLLFDVHDTVEHLAMMERILGPIPKTMSSRSRTSHFKKNGKLDLDMRCSRARSIRKHCLPLDQCKLTEDRDTDELFGLISSLMAYEPDSRTNIRHVKYHSFFTRLTHMERSAGALSSQARPDWLTAHRVRQNHESSISRVIRWVVGE